MAACLWPQHPEDPYIALSDFVAPKTSGIHDYVGVFAVTAGIGIEKLLEAHDK